MKENKVFLALGSNLGNREQNLKLALEELSQLGEITQKSKVHETEAVGPGKQDKYLNMGIELTTELTPTELIVKTLEIEHKLGRIREIENGPRTIDIDILLYNNEVINTPNLKIPHPGMHKRTFVLNPLVEIAAHTVHPQLNQTIEQLWTKLK